MKKTKLSIIIISIIVLYISAINVKAQNKKLGESRNPLKDLNLTEEQQKKIDDVRFKKEEIEIELEAKLDKNRLELKKLLSEQVINDSKILEMIDNSSKIKSELLHSKVEMWLNIKNILTDEQKRIWKEHFRTRGFERDHFFERNRLGFRDHDGERRMDRREGKNRMRLEN